MDAICPVIRFSVDYNAFTFNLGRKPYRREKKGVKGAEAD
jgi:hypothetical protein